MTQTKRQIVTPSQADAIEAYRKASPSSRLFAVAHLGQCGLSEREATQAIAMGYTIINEKGTII